MHKAPDLTRRIHEHFWQILAFCYARPVLSTVIESQFKGNWKYLEKTVFEISELRADQALLDIAVLLRALDDLNDINRNFQERGMPPIGTVTQADGSQTPLYFRDMTNKIMHAHGYEWNFADPAEPTVRCVPIDATRWKDAEVRISQLMNYLGGLMH